MRFSKRTDWNTEESDLARAYRERRAAGLPIADLTSSNPTKCGFEYLEDLLEPLVDLAALEYEPNPRGSLAAREAICGYYGDVRLKVAPEQILLTTSTSEAYGFLFKLLCDPGDGILVPQPSYPLFDFLADLEVLQVDFTPLVYDHGWQLDLEGLRRRVTSKTKAVVLVHPNNPTGHFTTMEEALGLAAICGEFKLALIVDEVFLDYSFVSAVQAPRKSECEEAKAEALSYLRPDLSDFLSPDLPGLQSRPLESSEETVDRGTFAGRNLGILMFVVSGISKICALPQMKVAWVVALGPGSEEAMGRLEVVADTYLSMNAPMQRALPLWLGGRGAIQGQILQRVLGNLAELDRQLEENGMVNRLRVEGGWYAVLRVPALQPDESTVIELLAEGVWVHPGYFFGMGRSGWLVVSLLGLSAEFSDGVRRLLNYFGRNLLSYQQT